MVSSRPPVHSRPTQPARKTGGIRVLGTAVTSGQGIAAPSSGSSANSKDKEKDVALYKRLFFPYSAHEQATATPSPPRRILQDPAASAALDVQLYNLLALIIRGFINPWFSKISRDRAFSLEILRVASHVFRQLEARLSEGPEAAQVHHIDKVKLVCESFPRVFERHVRDMRRARSTSGSAYAAGASINHLDSITPFEALFHSLQPHVAISSTSLSTSLEKLPSYIDADYLRAAIDALLKNLLPPDDYQAETERSVVREVILGIVLGGVFSKVAQPWFIYGLIAKLLEQSQAKRKLAVPSQERANASKEGPAWQRLIETLASLPVLFYRLTAFFTYLSLVITSALAAPSRPTHARRNLARPGSSLMFTLLRSEDEGRQVLKQVQWASDTACGVGSPLLDKIITHILYTKVFNVDTISTILQIVEGALFPGGYPAPSVPDPNEEEQFLLKERAYAAVENAIPASFLPYLLPGLPAADAQKQLAKDLLDTFDSHYCNLHLFMFILDLVVANLCPELVV